MILLLLLVFVMTHVIVIASLPATLSSLQDVGPVEALTLILSFFWTHVIVLFTLTWLGITPTTRKRGLNLETNSCDEEC